MEITLQEYTKDLPDFPEWVDASSKDMLIKGYLDTPSLKEQFIRMCETAAKWAPQDGENWAIKFFDMMFKGWYSNSTPCLSNLGARRKGMPVSCETSFLEDSIDGIYKTKHEIALLTKAGFGVSLSLDQLRPRGSSIAGYAKSNGVVPVIQGFQQDLSYVSQGNRRGSIAFYISTDHKDLKEVCTYLKENPKDLNMGFNITDDFVARLDAGDEEALEIYQSIMQNRYTSGKGYLCFTDKINARMPQWYADHGLKAYGSNLCCEVASYIDKDHTFNCTLGALNVALYDEWKDTDLIKTAMVYLDCVNSEFLDMAKHKHGFERIYNYASKFRPVGLGFMGYHTYMQDNMISFGSFESIMFSVELCKKMEDESIEASKYLAEKLGEPLGMIGYGLRFGLRLCTMPTKSSSNIMGGQSQGCEQYFSASFVEPLATGFVVRENPAFVRFAKAKGMYSEELMQDLAVNYNGSVQHLDWMSDHEKEVFRAVFETNQMEVIKLAAIRQKYIDQMQSLNLTFGPYVTPEEISAVHKEAIKNPNILSLYYMRRVTEDKSGTFKRTEISDCLACQ